MLSTYFFLKIGYAGNIEQHLECAEHIRAVFTKTEVRAEVHVVPDGWNTCLRIEVWVNSVETFHMLLGSLADWASVHYGRAVLEIVN